MFISYKTKKEVETKDLVLKSLEVVEDLQMGLEIASFWVREFTFNSNQGLVSICKPHLQKALENFEAERNLSSIVFILQAINYEKGVN